jgi:general secretion pathway protein F
MAAFAYNALDGTGRFVTGELRAESASAAVRQLLELGYVPLSTGSVRAERNGLWQLLLQRSRVSARDVTMLLQDLALLLHSGLPLDEGLRLLVDDANTSAARIIDRLRVAIRSGANFAEALQSHPATSLPELIAIVRSAEATGNLEHALNAIAQERRKREAVRARVQAAVRYPLFLLVVAAGVLLFFLLFVVPQFADVIRDFGTDTDPLVKVVISISDGLRSNGRTIGVIILLSFSVLAFLLRRRAARIRFLSLLARMPFIRGTVALRRTSLICRSLHTLLSNGVNLTDALRLMSESGLAGAALESVADKVRRGGRLAESLVETKLVPPLAIRMFRVGEESGALGAVAGRCADYYEAKLGEQIDKLTGIIGPAAIVFIATVVGTLMVSIMSTLLGINRMAM